MVIVVLTNFLLSLKVNLGERVTHMPTPNANKAVHSGFEPQIRCHQKSKIGVSLAPQKGLMSPKIKKERFLSNTVNEFHVEEDIYRNVMTRAILIDIATAYGFDYNPPPRLQSPLPRKSSNV